MSVQFHGLSIDAADPAAVAGFWGGLLRWTERPETDGSITLHAGDVAAHPGAAAPYVITVRPAATEKEGQNRIHLDLTSESPQAMAEQVQRALEGGGRLIDIGQSADDRHEVVADPEGNELCVIEPGNNFLAGTGAIGAINCDGSQALGYFWSRALDWPLVWDQDEETAIQSPAGGTKLTWSGPPLMPRYAADRVRLVVRADAIGVSLLRELGAQPLATGTMTDPDGNEFTVLPA